MANLKFTGLPKLDDVSDSLADNDLLAILDYSGTDSKAISAVLIAKYVFSTASLTPDRVSNVISKINSAAGANGNTLNATNVYANGSYRNGAYLLDYANATNTPTIPTDISNLNNTLNYISLNNAAQPLLEVKGAGSTISGTLSTNFIAEGTLNKYYEDSKVDLRLENQFGRLFNLYSNAFDGGAVSDSLIDISGTFQSISASGTSSTILIDASTQPSIKSTTYKAGQVLRIYGAELTDPTPLGAATVSVDRQAFAATASDGGSAVTFEYKVAHFNLKTGAVGVASSASSVIIAKPALNITELLASFNEDHFIKVTINNSSTETGLGVLVYRKIVGIDTEDKLLAVLGSKELSSQWNDYHTYDQTSWGGKNPLDNTFNTTYPITHFPMFAPTASSVGWTDVSISQVLTSGGAGATYTITLDTPVVVNANGACQLAHNDTGLIQNAITAKNAVGIKSVSLNAKNYNISQLIVPDNFGLVGVPNITKITNLAFSGYAGDVQDNNALKSASSTNSNAISLSGIDFDGNIRNQYLVADVTDTTLNYLVNFGINPVSVLLDKCRFKNMIGGGIYASSPSEFKMNVCEVVHSGLSDRYEDQYSPLIVDGGSSTLVTGNRFEGFPNHIDASVTSEGVFTNNVIKACGTGLFLYGSTFTVSSPNILLGAANEFLSTPDILNSEFDSINLTIANMTAGTGIFLSDPFVYQENGASFDLSFSDATPSAFQIVYRVNLVSTLLNGDTQIYGNTLGPSVTGVAGRTDMPLRQGRRYTIVEPGNTDWRKVGAVANKKDISFICELTNLNTAPILEIVGATTASSTGHVTANEFVGYTDFIDTTLNNTPDTVVYKEPIDFSDVEGSQDRTKGEFKFSIPNSLKTEIISGAYSQGALRTFYSGAGASAHDANSKHSGLGWSASLRREVTCGSISSVGTFQDGTDATFGDYRQISLSVVSPAYIAVGDHVIVSGKSNWNLGITKTTAANAFDPEHGIVQSLAANLVTIRYYKGLNTTSATAGVPGSADGTLNIIDDFVMAQGLIK